MGDKVTFFTIHCPNCKVLQTLMTKKGIAFDVVDDKTTVLSVADQHGVKSAPFAMINGEIYNAKQLQAWIKEQ